MRQKQNNTYLGFCFIQRIDTHQRDNMRNNMKNSRNYNAFLGQFLPDNAYQQMYRLEITRRNNKIR